MAEFLIQCAECGVDVLTDNASTKFCSTECRDANKLHKIQKAKYEENAEKFKDVEDIPTCKVCGFKGLNLTKHLRKVHGLTTRRYRELYKDKYLVHPSVVEKTQSKLKTEEKECPECGTHFMQKHMKQKYCSDECAYEEKKRYNRELHRRRKDPNYVHKDDRIRECKQCGTKFQTKHENKHFCTKRCYHKYNNNKKREKLKAAREEKNCVQCGKTLKKRQLKFCSVTCQKKYNKPLKAERLEKKLQASLEKYKDVPDIPTCKICGYKGKVLTGHLKEAHNMTKKEYMEKYDLELKDVIHPDVSESSSKTVRRTIARDIKKMQEAESRA